MTQIETRLKKLEIQFVPPLLDDRVIFRISVPAVNGKVCPEFAARGVQTATCGDLTISRESGESEETFEARVSDAVRVPGGVVSVLLE